MSGVDEGGRVEDAARVAEAARFARPPIAERPPLDRRALGLALTRIANVTTARALPNLSGVPATRARRIGITGAPGAGKSTLAGRLALARMTGCRLGILAIDPSSPKTGGAILGDRIRMDDLEGSENLFIRSFGSRSAADGLTDNLHELLETMDRHGFDEVIVETVGVGQAELAARSQVDTLILVIPPDAGDVVQAMKAGIMEIADVFAINKSDMPSAPKMATEVKRIMALTHRGHRGQRDDAEWIPPVVLTSHANPDSIAELSRQVDRHQAWLQASGTLGSQLLARRKYRLQRWLERQAHEIIDGAPAAFFDLPEEQQMKQVLQRLGELDGPRKETRS
jgi:LAO/AO transport system kinase